MGKYLYLSLMPEALIASMLPPEDFGNYLAVGTRKRTRGQAVFFEVDPDFESDWFNLADLENRCQPNEDGTPKRSKYLKIYRALEHIPIKNLRKLYLATDDGRVLGLERGDYSPPVNPELHLYQQLSPVSVRVASRLDEREFIKFITNTKQPISVPKIVFVDLKLNGLATDPLNGSIANLPYPNIDHLRDCLLGLRMGNAKPTKTVIRYLQGDLLYRTINEGLFVGDQNEMAFYPFPTLEELENKYYTWWRSALVVSFH